MFGTRCSTRCDAVQFVCCGLLLVTVHLCVCVWQFLELCRIVGLFILLFIFVHLCLVALFPGCQVNGLG